MLLFFGVFLAHELGDLDDIIKVAFFLLTSDAMSGLDATSLWFLAVPLAGLGMGVIGRQNER